MYPERQGWGAFGAYALGGDLPREEPLRAIEARIQELQGSDGDVGAATRAEIASLQTEWRRRAGDLYWTRPFWSTSAA